MAGGTAPGVTHEYPVRFDTPIRTERLVLRPWRPRDEADRNLYRRLMADPGVVRYHYTDVLDATGSDERLAQRDAVIDGPGGWMNLAVETADTGVTVGEVGLAWMGDDHRQAEIGYTLAPEHHGRGYATEAATAMVDLAFSVLGAHRVTGRLDARNTASARVLQRLGMRHEALLVQNEWVKGEWTDEAVYAVLADEWAARTH